MDLDIGAYAPSPLENVFKAITEQFRAGYQSIPVRDVGTLVIRLMRRYTQEEPTTKVQMARNDFFAIRHNQFPCDDVHAHAALADYESASNHILSQVDRLVSTYEMACDTSLGRHLVDCYADIPFAQPDGHDQMSTFLARELKFDTLAHGEATVEALYGRSEMTQVIAHTGLRTDLYNGLIEFRRSLRGAALDLSLHKWEGLWRRALPLHLELWLDMAAAFHGDRAVLLVCFQVLGYLHRLFDAEMVLVCVRQGFLAEHQPHRFAMALMSMAQLYRTERGRFLPSTHLIVPFAVPSVVPQSHQARFNWTARARYPLVAEVVTSDFEPGEEHDVPIIEGDILDVFYGRGGDDVPTPRPSQRPVQCRIGPDPWHPINMVDDVELLRQYADDVLLLGLE